MSTRFILDRNSAEQKKTLAEIFQLVEKKPYPTEETIKLARFVNACFFVFLEEKQQQMEKEKHDAEELELKKREEQQRQAEHARLATLEAEAPAAPGEGQSFEKKEYLLRLYDTPIGIVLDTKDDKMIYHVVEPALSADVLEKAKEIGGRDLQKDNSLFDNRDFLRKLTEKTARKMAIPLTDLLISQLRYYLERDILGAGKFDAFLHDPKVKSVVCSGVNRPVLIDYENSGMIETSVVITDNEDVNMLIRRVAFATGKKAENSILEATFQGFAFEGSIGLGGQSSRVTIRRIE